MVGRRMPGEEYYDREAGRYDDTRGGVVRARDAADAITRLAGGVGGAGSGGRRLVDVAGGTGIVGAELARDGWDVTVVDLSAGMLAQSAARLPGRGVRAGATALPLRDGAVDVVATVWLLHLLGRREVAAAVGEAARVLAPDGLFLTTVDKSAAHGRGPLRATDHRPVVERLARSAGLVPAGETTFSGPSAWGSATAEDPVFTLVAYRAGA